MDLEEVHDENPSHLHYESGDSIDGENVENAFEAFEDHRSSHEEIFDNNDEYPFEENEVFVHREEEHYNEFQGDGSDEEFEAHEIQDSHFAQEDKEHEFEENFEENFDHVDNSPLGQFQLEFKQRVSTHDEEEKKRKHEIMRKAQEELDRIREERLKRREIKYSSNREDEEEVIKTRDAALQNDKSWDRVATLVDLRENSVPGQSDVNRMRQLLIQLKNDPILPRA